MYDQKPYLFIYLRFANRVLLGTQNATRSGQCFHGAEGVLVKLRSFSVKNCTKARIEILDLE